MSYSGGLPYESTPPLEEPSISASADPLDRPLSDYHLSSTSTTDQVPEHVKSLMGRMGRGKVYLADESPALLHVGGKEERIAHDPVGRSILENTFDRLEGTR
jgi:hypothetical protein